MLIVLYEENGIKQFEETNLELKDFTSQNPGKNIVMVFDKDDEIFQKDQRQKDHFDFYAKMFGFSPDQRNAVFYDGQGDLLRLIDFIPKNRKYKCMCEKVSNGVRYKMTARYVQKKIQEYNAAKEQE